MNITPVSFNFGRYYDFDHNDPRKNYRGFYLGMPDEEVVENVSGGDNYFYKVTAEEIRARYIRQSGLDYETYYPSHKVIGKRKDEEGHPYDVTAGQAREEILEEEKEQLKREKIKLEDKRLKAISGGFYSAYSNILPSWDREPY